MSVDALPCSAGTVSPLANALSLEPSWSSRYLRPSAERGRIRNVESLEVELGDDLAVRVADRAHVLDHADAAAARADLVARHEVGAVGHAHLQRRRRHERQALVRVVGQEDRDDHDEDRHAADEDGVGCDAGSGLPHGASR
jgi:hypothetical protein